MSSRILALTAKFTAECIAESTAERTAECTAEYTAEYTAGDTAERTAERTAKNTAEDTVCLAGLLLAFILIPTLPPKERRLLKVFQCAKMFFLRVIS